MLVEIDDDARERLARLWADGAEVEDAIALWTELENPEEMVQDVDIGGGSA